MSRRKTLQKNLSQYLRFGECLCQMPRDVIERIAGDGKRLMGALHGFRAIVRGHFRSQYVSTCLLSVASLFTDKATMSTTFLIFGVAASNFLTGKLGLLLALPPGYATSIWPPSGISLAVALTFGAKALPGVFLGSILIFLF